MIRVERHSGVEGNLVLVSPRGKSAPPSPALSSFGLPQRLVLFAILFALEWIPISHLVHTDLVRARGSWIVAQLLRLVVVSGSFFFAFAYLRARSTFEQISDELKRSSIGWTLLSAHLGAFLAFCCLLFLPFGGSSSSFYLSAMTVVFAAAWGLAVALCLGAFVPAKAVGQLVSATGLAWVHSLVVGLAAWIFLQFFPAWHGRFFDPNIDLSWRPATEATFDMVHMLLRLFVSDVMTDRALMKIGTPTFRVEIGAACAGFEGIGLITVFGSAWLWLTRREFRFPHALLLIPAGMCVIWMANAIRITVLILIGVAGAPDIAVGGFHSQAGWIAFNCVALSLAAFSNRIPWVTRHARRATDESDASPNPTAAYLMPFLAILGAGMVSHASSGSFEYLYPLRLLAAVAALWYFRRTYADLNWRFGWEAVLSGLVVFGIWIGLDVLLGSAGASGIGAGLASMSPAARMSWLAIRVCAACVTVPIAEELAFRGFLIRRLISGDFESLSTRQYTFLSIAISSVAFGLLHGDRWIAGAFAGLFYAAVFLRRGRIGDAVVAHATTNAALAAWVLASGKWYLW